MDNSKSAAMKGVWRNDLWSTEILITIFMSVNIVDLAVASLVCKMWNTACRDPSLWGKIDYPHSTTHTFSTYQIINQELTSVQVEKLLNS